MNRTTKPDARDRGSCPKSSAAARSSEQAGEVCAPAQHERLRAHADLGDHLPAHVPLAHGEAAGEAGHPDLVDDSGRDAIAR
jgi:hypothetical protein